MYIDAYSEMYQRINGFEVTILSNPTNKKAFLSMKPTTRAAYDLSMRENSVDGIITMDNIKSDLKAGNLFYINEDPSNIYIIQSCSYWEQQPNTRNINAVRTNCMVDILRLGYSEDTGDNAWIKVYEGINGFISELLKDSKNFNSGFEVATVKSVQIPKIDIDGKVRSLSENDRIVVKNLSYNTLECLIQVESVDNFGVEGVVRLQGTQDIRT